MTTEDTTRGYRRISLDTEASGSLSEQTRRIKAAETAAGRDPDRIVWYEDRTVSGSKVALADRTAGAQLLVDLRPGDRVVFTKVDRAGRNTRDLLSIHDRIAAAGASVQFLDLSVDTSTPTGELVFTVMAALASWEARTIGARRKGALEGFAVEGRHAVGKAPIGFRSVENPNGRGLVIEKDPETAPLVREAVLRVLAGESQNVVRRSLDLSKTGFHNLLTNPRLAGMTPRNGGVAMVDGAPLVNPDAAILSPAEWQRLRGFMTRSTKAWSRQGGYGRALACGECGSRLYVNVSKRKAEYSTYRCRRPEGTHTLGEPAVGIMSIAANEFVESKFLEMWGSEEYRILTVSEDDTDRRNAVAAAEIRLEELERHMRSAGRDERRALNDALMNAYDAVETAKALPTVRQESVTDIGRTIAEVWAESDDAYREQLIAAFGSFVVTAGKRGGTPTPVADRITWEGFTPDGLTANGEPARWALIDAPEGTQRSMLGEVRTVPAGLRVAVRPA